MSLVGFEMFELCYGHAPMLLPGCCSVPSCCGAGFGQMLGLCYALDDFLSVLLLAN